MYVSPEDIHNAVAKALADNIEDEYNLYGYPEQHPAIPALSVWPSAGDYIAYFGTMGPNGTADMMLRIKADVGAIDSENVAQKMFALHAVGALATSSVVEALMKDRTLGGIIQDIYVGRSSWPIEDGVDQSGVAWWEAAIIFKKDGAAA